MGLVSGGLQDEQFFDASPDVVWLAVKSGVKSTKYFKKVRDLHDLTMRIVYASRWGDLMPRLQ